MDSLLCVEYSKLVSLHIFIYVLHVSLFYILIVFLIQESLKGLGREVSPPLEETLILFLIEKSLRGLVREDGFGLGWSRLRCLS